MTSIYFVRHALPDHNWREDRTRPLTEEGMNDAKKVTKFFLGIKIDFFISSPYRRSIETIKNLSETLGMGIQTDEDFRERNAGAWLYDNFLDYIKKQWDDFAYHIKDGECLNEVQERNIRALNKVLTMHSNETIVIATHGTALSTILNYYNPRFQYEDFMRIVDFMPYIIRLDFDGDRCLGMTEEFIMEKK